MSSWEPDRRGVALYNLGVWSRGLPAIEEMNRESIPVIVLKGLPQVEDLYGDIAGRASSDVDLVVRSDDVMRAFEVLLAAGWEPLEHPTLVILQSLHGVERAIRSRPWHFAPVRRESGAMIDLHSDGMERHWKPTLDPGIWQRAQQVSMDEVTLRILSPEDRLLFLCWHFFSDSASRGMLWHKLRDIELILQHPDDLDWEYLDQRARATGMTLCLRLACDLARSRGSTPIAPVWRTRVPISPRRRCTLLSALLGTRWNRIVFSRPLIVLLVLPDDLRVMLPLWREIFFPSRATVALSLGHLPSRPRYVAQLGGIYAHRVRNLYRRLRALRD
jgi:hypothetical protein